MMRALLCSTVLLLALTAIGCGDSGGGGPEEACEPSGLFCEDGEYCDRGSRCEGPGMCRPVPDPSECPSGGTAVCGCDGTTYENDCLAAAAGVAVQSEGACGDAGSP